MNQTDFNFDSEEETREERYKRIKKIGFGAFGEVAQCIDVTSGRVVAVKSIHKSSDDETANAAVLREIQCMKYLNGLDRGGGRVVRLLDVYSENAYTLSLVMECAATDLAQVLARRTAHFPRPLLKACTQMMLAAVAFCHEHLVCHRYSSSSLRAAETRPTLSIRHIVADGTPSRQCCV
jgi:serine/threonine protein kinase